MSMGRVIYYHRKKSGWTQEQLCENICSITHLSKIENGSREIHHDTLLILFEKLGISLLEEKEKLDELQRKLTNFWRMIERKNDNVLDKLYADLKSDDEYIKYTDHVFLYELTCTRYWIYKKELSIVDTALKDVYKSHKKFSQFEMFLFKFLSALYYLQQKDYLSSLNFLEEIENLENKFSTEVTEFSYYNSLIYCHLNKASLAIHYANKAIKIFQEQQNFKRVIDAKTILAIQLTKLSRINEAEVIFTDILNNATLLNDIPIMYYAYHNLGYLFNKKKDYKKAIYYYQESLKIAIPDSNNYFLSLTNIINNHLLSKNYGLAKEISKNALKNITDKNSEIFVKIKVLYLKSMQHQELYYKFLENSAIPTMLESNNIAQQLDYIEQLIQFYQKEGDSQKELKYLTLYYNIQKNNYKKDD